MRRRSPNERIFRVLIDGQSKDTLAKLANFHIDCCCMPQMRSEQGHLASLHAYATEGTVEELRKAGHSVRVIADRADERQRQFALVGKGDRFAGGTICPKPVGRLV